MTGGPPRFIMTNMNRYTSLAYTRPPARRPEESGNVIWILLVAIVLMASLTVILTRTSETTEQSGSTELANIQASDIMRYAQGLEQGVATMMMRGKSGNDINFENSFVTGYTPHSACNDDDCKLFHTMGGAQTYIPPKSEWLNRAKNAQPHYGTWLFTGATCVQGIGDDTEDIATDCAGNGVARDQDLLVMLPYLTKSLCMQINRLSGVSNPGGNPPVGPATLWSATPHFTGNYTDDAGIGANDTTIYRKKSGCIEQGGNPATGNYVFYYTLIGR